MEKIKNIFLTILRDIKKDIANGEQPVGTATATMLQTMSDALAGQQPEPVSNDVAAMIAGQIGQFVPMD